VGHIEEREHSSTILQAILDSKLLSAIEAPFNLIGRQSCPFDIISMMDQRTIVLYLHLKRLSAHVTHEDLVAALGLKSVEYTTVTSDLREAKVGVAELTFDLEPCWMEKVICSQNLPSPLSLKSPPTWIRFQTSTAQSSPHVHCCRTEAAHSPCETRPGPSEKSVHHPDNPAMMAWVHFAVASAALWRSISDFEQWFSASLQSLRFLVRMAGPRLATEFAEFAIKSLPSTVSST
jgi:hypothetical protein